jgi:hypothetical protein
MLERSIDSPDSESRSTRKEEIVQTSEEGTSWLAAHVSSLHQLLKFGIQK